MNAALTTARVDDGNTTTWAVHTDIRATTLTIARGTPDQVTRMIEAAPSAAGFCDVDTAAVLVNVSSHDQTDEDLGSSEDCLYLGRCDRDTFDRHIERTLFHAAAKAGFADDAVWALLAELHAKAGAL
jgi:hypothetical protein